MRSSELRRDPRWPKAQDCPHPAGSIVDTYHKGEVAHSCCRRCGYVLYPPGVGLVTAADCGMPAKLPARPGCRCTACQARRKRRPA